MHIYTDQRSTLEGKNINDLESLDWLSFRNDSVRPNTFGSQQKIC